MRWSEAGYLSRIVLTHAPRQASVSLILGVGRVKTHADDNVITFPAPSDSPVSNAARRLVDTMANFGAHPNNPAKELWMILGDWEGIPKAKKEAVLEEILSLSERG